MIYLLRVVGRSIQLAACEDDTRAPAREAQGYRQVTRAEYIAAWRKRDWLTMQMGVRTVRLANAAPPPLLSRAVGEPPDAPPGFTRFFHKNK